MSEDATFDEMSETTGESKLKSWSEISLGEVANIIGGKAFSSDQYVGDGIPLIRITNIGSESSTEKDLKYLSKSLLEKVDSKYILEKDDILMALSGATTGKVSRISSKYTPALLNQRIAKFDTGDDLNHYFLLFCLQSYNSQRHIITFASGGAQDNISTYDLGRISIPQPPFPEQCKIASVLYTVDQAIQKTEDCIEQLKWVLIGLRKKMFSHTGQDLKELRIGPQTIYMPTHWDLHPLGEITRDITEIDHHMPDKTETGVPFLAAGEIDEIQPLGLDNAEKVSEDDWERLSTKLNPERGDIVYTRFGTIGIAKKVETDDRFLPSYSIALIKPDQTAVVPSFLEHALNSEFLRKQAERRTRGSANRNLNLGEIHKMELPTPPKSEQEEWSDQLNSVVDAIRVETSQKTRLNRVKRGLMQDLLSGTVRTTDTNIEVPDEIMQYG